MAISAQVGVQYSSSQTGVHTVTLPNFEPRIAATLSFEDGVGLNQADLQYVVKRVMAAGASETIDLSTGLIDAFGQPVAFAEIVSIVLIADAENTDDISVGGAATTPWTGIFGDATDKVIIPPGGFFAIGGGGDPGIGAVAAGFKDLKITNQSADAGGGYHLAILGRTQ